MTYTNASAKANATYFNYARELNQRVRNTLSYNGMTVYRDSNTISFDVKEYIRWNNTDHKVACLLSDLRKSVDAQTQQRVINAFPYAVALIVTV